MVLGHPETVLITIGSNCTKGIFKRVPVLDVPGNRRELRHGSKYFMGIHTGTSRLPVVMNGRGVIEKFLARV